MTEPDLQERLQTEIETTVELACYSKGEGASRVSREREALDEVETQRTKSPLKIDQKHFSEASV